MLWATLIPRIFVFLGFGLALGWYFDHPWLGGAASLLTVLLLWCYEMWRLHRWLESPGELPTGVYGIWGEISSKMYKLHKQGEDARQRLQSTVDYLLESFASMRDGVVIVESGGGIRWCNEAASQLLGLRFPEDTGQAITNLVRYPDFTSYVHAGDFTEPLYFGTNSESQLHLQVIITRFGDGDSLIFVRDVTERVKTEQMRRDFVGNVSHELRTPLTVITGYLGTLLGNVDALPPAFVKPMRQMEQQAQRMENLLTDLLWLSRIENEKRETEPELVDVAALLEELREELKGSHPDHRIDLKVEDRFCVSGDYRQLYSAVSNLVRNAIKYSQPSCPITVTWQRRGSEYALAVRDRGIGIDERHIPRLTERFYRVDDSRSSSTGGTGLGLAIVKHVAASHGARLEIDSKPGTGSTFTLVFNATGVSNNQARA
jgi:two-component system phosphate regulon sensor histidine kinase PhoR